MSNSTHSSAAARGWDRPDPNWTEFTRVENPQIDAKAIRKFAARYRYAFTDDEALSMAQEHMDYYVDRGIEYWRNNQYLVLKADAHELEALPPEVPPMWWLRVFRRDGKRMGAGHWSIMQRIKNELIGPLNEGVELYPALHRLADGEHSYHLWVMQIPGDRFWFGLPPQSALLGSPCIPHHCITDG